MTPASPSRVVLDASALLPLFVPEAGSGAIRFLFEWVESDLAVVHAPRLPQIECAHGLLKYVRRGAFSHEEAVSAYQDLLDLPIVLHDLHTLSAIDFAEASHRVVGAYDAVYLALARRLGAPLVTQDERFSEKVKSFIQVVPLEFLPTALRTGQLH